MNQKTNIVRFKVNICEHTDLNLGLVIKAAKFLNDFNADYKGTVRVIIQINIDDFNSHFQ